MKYGLLKLVYQDEFSKTTEYKNVYETVIDGKNIVFYGPLKSISEYYDEHNNLVDKSESITVTGSCQTLINVHMDDIKNELFKDYKEIVWEQPLEEVA